MSNAPQVEGDNFREAPNENKKTRARNYDYIHKKSSGANRSKSQLKFTTPTPSSAFVPSSNNMYD